MQFSLCFEIYTLDETEENLTSAYFAAFERPNIATLL